MIVDLHTHSSASDGVLAPGELLELAKAGGVELVSITDHDTVAAYELLAGRIPAGLRLVPGIELSTCWGNRGIHVVGLGIDPRNATLLAATRRQQAARHDRARRIAARLARLGIPDSLDAVRAIAGSGGIGRPHFARHLVDTGVVRDEAAAFRRYLGDGKPGCVAARWAPLDVVLGWIAAAGGVAVLAHPAKYRLTRTRLRLLVAEFSAAGGGAIEVVCGNQPADVTRTLAALAEEFGLAVSAGSDFHGPETNWSRPGRYAALPGKANTVWQRWAN